MVGRVALAGAPVQIDDVLTDTEVAESLLADQAVGGFRTLLGVPLLREGAVIGVLSLRRNEVRPFTDRQVSLVRTFATRR